MIAQRPEREDHPPSPPGSMRPSRSTNLPRAVASTASSEDTSRLIAQITLFSTARGTTDRVSMSPPHIHLSKGNFFLLLCAVTVTASQLLVYLPLYPKIAAYSPETARIHGFIENNATWHNVTQRNLCSSCSRRTVTACLHKNTLQCRCYQPR